MTTALAPLTATTLTAAQQLERLENVIEGGLQAFCEVGRALATIRDRKLYLGQFRTFEDYLAGRWNIRKTYGYDLIRAASVVDSLSAIADTLPANEAQARLLAPLSEEARRLAWIVVEQTAPEPEKITAKHIERVVRVLREAVSTGAIDAGTGESIPVVADALKAAVTYDMAETLKRQQQYIMERATPRKLIARGKATVSEVVVRGDVAAVTLVMDASALGTLGAGLIVQVVVREDVSA